MGIRYFSFYLGTFLFVSVVGAAAWAEGPFGIKPSAVPGLSQWNTVERLPDGREGLISWTRDRSGKIRGNLDSIRQSNGVFSSAQVREYLAGASPQAPAKVAPAKPVEKPVEKPAEKKVEKPKEATSGPVRRTFEPELPQLPKEIPLARAPRVVAPPSIPSVTVPDLPKRDAGFKTPQGIIPKFSRTEPTDFPGVSKQTEYYAPQVNGNGVVSIKRPSDKAIVLGSQVLPLSGGKKQVIIQQENGLKVKREFSLDEQGSVQSKITHVEAGPRNNPWYPVKEGEPVSILHTANPTDTKATARSFVSSDGVVKDVVLDPKTNQWQKVEPPKKGFDRESLVQSLETTEKNLLAQVSEARKKQEQTEREVASGYQGAFPRVIADAVRPLVQSATSVDFSSVMQEAAKKIPGKAGSAHGLPMNVVLGAEEKPSKVAILAATGREGRLDVQTAIQSLQEGDLKKSFQSGMQSYLGGFNRALSAFSSKAPETPSFLKPYQEVVSDSVQNSSSVTLAKAVGTVFQKSVQGNLALPTTVVAVVDTPQNRAEFSEKVSAGQNLIAKAAGKKAADTAAGMGTLDLAEGRAATGAFNLGGFGKRIKNNVAEGRYQDGIASARDQVANGKEGREAMALFKQATEAFGALPMAQGALDFFRVGEKSGLPADKQTFGIANGSQYIKTATGKSGISLSMTLADGNTGMVQVDPEKMPYGEWRKLAGLLDKLNEKGSLKNAEVLNAVVEKYFKEHNERMEKEKKAKDEEELSKLKQAEMKEAQEKLKVAEDSVKEKVNDLSNFIGSVFSADKKEETVEVPKETELEEKKAALTEAEQQELEALIDQQIQLPEEKLEPEPESKSTHR